MAKVVQAGPCGSLSAPSRKKRSNRGTKTMQGTCPSNHEKVYMKKTTCLRYVDGHQGHHLKVDKPSIAVQQIRGPQRCLFY